MRLLDLAPDVWDHGATFSECPRYYRYVLWRGWNPSLPSVAFCGLNPSTATEDKDDPTIRKCQTLARAWGFGRLVMVNAFAWRSTDPHGLLDAEEPTGPDNDLAIAEAARNTSRFVMAWGAFHDLRELLAPRATVLRRLVHENAREYGHLGANKDGSPKHPLYLANATAFVRTGPGA